MVPVVSSVSFSLSFPGADEEYLLLVYDALKEKEDSRFRVAMDIDGRIVVAYDPSFSNDARLDTFPERASAISTFVSRVVSEAVQEADRRYHLYKELSRIDEALSDAREESVLADLVPSVW